MIYVSKIKTPLGRFRYNSTRYLEGVKQQKPRHFVPRFFVIARVPDMYTAVHSLLVLPHSPPV